jgi:hypothetical protein
MKKNLIPLAIIILCLFGFNSAFSQIKLVAIAPPVVYDNALESGVNTEIYNIPTNENPLKSIINKLDSKKYSELHIYAVTEANMIGFHLLGLSINSLDDNKAILEEFKRFNIKIVFHSKVLGTGASGQLFLSKLSKLMGSSVEVQK